MPIPNSIIERIETFARNLDSYLNPDYKEAQVRQEFIDPLFAALGWDVRNDQGYAEAYKDVVHEDSLRIAGVGIKAPDYSFRVGGTRKFFVEAKKPAIYLKDNPEPAHQLRVYSFSAKLPLGIVTDFQEFAIYDTRLRPKATDKASVGRIFYCTYEQYPEKWDEIAGIFSREAILKGSFDRHAAATKGKRGTTEFDAEFLKDMEHWRDLLARNLALRNAALTQRQLNFAVQRILDRIIFLRIAEDRGIEPYGQLQALIAGPKIYGRLREIFERADYRYNSGLFHFTTEKGREEAPDRLTLGLELDDAVLKEIIGALYWPKSPYAFAVIPADILGHIYEQFLGKVIHLTADHRARVEEKPEVRKAGGVYYTPTYIVDYIVRQTVGPLVDGKTPRQVAKLTVLDPACGSGSFLLGAYEFLLDWHLNYYVDHDPVAWAKKKNPPIYETAPNLHGVGRGSGNWQLTTAERKRILTANLYGVDIDAQAVEVTKLSLLLKVLEGEARELQGKQLDFHRVLPDLGNNIKCGNSLIGSDFYAQPNLPTLDDESRIKINAFDWAHEFKPIMDRGGFDVIVGNPPYIQLSMKEFRDPVVNAHLKSSFGMSGGRLNTFIFFIERVRELVNQGGHFGLIVPNTISTQEYYEEARARLLDHTWVRQLIQPIGQVFTNAVVENVILIAKRNGKRSKKGNTMFGNLSPKGISNVKHVSQSEFLNNFNFSFVAPTDPKIAALRGKVSASPDSFGALLNINQAIALKGDRAACLDSERLSANHREMLDGRHIRRYFTGTSPNFFKFDLNKIHSCKREDIFMANEKILFRRVGDSLIGTLDTSQKFALNTLVVMTPAQQTGHNIRFFLGLFNSKLLNFYYTRFLKSTKKVFSEIQARQVAQLPVPKLEFSNSSDRCRHDTIVAHVERMLKLHTDLAAAKTPDAQTHFRRDIAATDRAIDQLVYELYELTPDEISLVEQATVAPVQKPEAKETLSFEVLSTLKERSTYFSYEDIQTAVRKENLPLQDASLRVYLTEATKQGVIHDAGRGWYSRLNNPVHLDPKPLARLIRSVEKAFPLLDFTVWSTAQINPWMHHLLAHPVALLHAESETLESIGDTLRAQGWEVAVNPPPSTASKSVRPGEKMVVLRPSLSKQPPTKSRQAPIEKILVDLIVEAPLLGLMDTSEAQAVAQRVVNRYLVQVSVMQRYADSRHTKLDALESINQRHSGGSSDVS